MFRSINNKQNNQQPEAKDPNVQKTAQQEQNLIQPAGNEAANVELMEQILQEQKNNNNPGNAPRDEKKDEKKPSQKVMNEALKAAEEIVREQGPEAEKDLPPVSTYDYAPDDDMVAEADPEEYKRDKDYASQVNKLPKTSVENAEGNEDARWKAEAAKRVKKHFKEYLFSTSSRSTQYS